MAGGLIWKLLIDTLNFLFLLAHGRCHLKGVHQDMELGITMV
jgi:hypothetical protein